MHEGGGGGGGKGKTAEQEKAQKTPKRDLGVLRQPHNFPDWKALRFFGPGKSNKEVSVSEMDGGGEGRGVVRDP